MVQKSIVGEWVSAKVILRIAYSNKKTGIPSIWGPQYRLSQAVLGKRGSANRPKKDKLLNFLPLFLYEIKIERGSVTWKKLLSQVKKLLGVNYIQKTVTGKNCPLNFCPLTHHCRPKFSISTHFFAIQF